MSVRPFVCLLVIVSIAPAAAFAQVSRSPLISSSSTIVLPSALTVVWADGRQGVAAPPDAGQWQADFDRALSRKKGAFIKIFSGIGLGVLGLGVAASSPELCVDGGGYGGEIPDCGSRGLIGGAILLIGLGTTGWGVAQLINVNGDLDAIRLRKPLSSSEVSLASGKLLLSFGDRTSANLRIGW